jgi:hypothetical protein
MRAMSLNFFNIKQSKIIKTVGWIFLTIILGAIGSGLWERLLSHGFQIASNYLLFSISYLFHGYLDILHSNIGKADVNEMVILPYLILSLAFMLGLWLMIIYSYKLMVKMIDRTYKLKNIINEKEGDDEENRLPTLSEISEIIEKREKRLKKGKKLMLMMVTIAFVFTIIMLTSINRDNYNRNACIFI